MGLVLEAGAAHALPLPPQSNGGQGSCRDSVGVLCVITLLKTKIRVQVPAWWDRGVPSGSGGSAHQKVVWELLGVTGLLSAWLQGCCSSCSEGVVAAGFSAGVNQGTVGWGFLVPMTAAEPDQ